MIMKKAFLVILLLASNMSFAQTTVCDATFPPPLIQTIYGKVYSNPISTAYAATIVKNYTGLAATAQVDNQIGFFIFDAGTLFKYLYNIKASVQDVQFLLGRDNTGALTVVIVGVDAQHKNLLYYNDAKCTNCVLAFPFAGDLVDPFENLTINPTPAAGTLNQKMCPGVIFPTSNIPAYSLFIPKEQAPAIIKAYVPTTATMPTSFLFDAGKLASYLASTSNIQNVALVFAKEGTSPTSIKMVVIGVDMNGKPIGMSVGGFTQALEHCYPCPADCPGAIFMAEKADINFMIK